MIGTPAPTDLGFGAMLGLLAYVGGIAALYLLVRLLAGPLDRWGTRVLTRAERRQKATQPVSERFHGQRKDEHGK